MRYKEKTGSTAGPWTIVACLWLLFLVGCGSGSDSSLNPPDNDQPPVNEDENFVFSSPVYYLHGYIRSDQVGIRLLPVDETFELQYTEATFAASSGVLRISGPCYDLLIDASRRDDMLFLTDYRNARPLGCLPTFINETLSDTSRAVVSVMQSDSITVESTEDYLLFRPQGGELLAFSTRPLRAIDQELNDEADLSQSRWTLESIRTLDSGIAAVPLAMPVFMSFGDGQNLDLELGCSSGTGGARIGSGIISVIDLSFTESICTPDGTTQNYPTELVEEFFTRANVNPLAYSLRNDQLTLFNGRDTALVFSGRLIEEVETYPTTSEFARGDLTEGGVDAMSAERRTDIIRDQVSLDALYSSLVTGYGLTQLEPPIVDFTRYTVISAFYGYDSQSGYDLVVRNAVESERGLDVYLTSRDPDTGILNTDCFAGDAESAPFSLVLVDSRQSPVTTRIRETSFCSGLWDIAG